MTQVLHISYMLNCVQNISEDPFGMLDSEVVKTCSAVRAFSQLQGATTHKTAHNHRCDNLSPTLPTWDGNQSSHTGSLFRQVAYSKMFYTDNKSYNTHLFQLHYTVLCILMCVCEGRRTDWSEQHAQGMGWEKPSSQWAESFRKWVTK